MTGKRFICIVSDTRERAMHYINRKRLASHEYRVIAIKEDLFGIVDADIIFLGESRLKIDKTLGTVINRKVEMGHLVVRDG